MTILDFDSNVFMAPMAGITDKPLRKLTSTLGKGAMVSEMVAVNAIQRKNPKTYRIADVSDEPYPVVVQLVGGNPELFYDAVQLVSELGAHSIDINMGCPVKKIVNNNSGSALMKDLSLASKIISSAVKASPLKVSVKFRKGWDAGSVNAVEFAKMCEDSGADMLTVHGRTRDKIYAGEVNYAEIERVKRAVRIPVIANGGVFCGADADILMGRTGADGVMVARGAMYSPWIFADLTGAPLPDRRALVLKQLDDTLALFGERFALVFMRKMAAFYTKGQRNSSALREQLFMCDSVEKLREMIASTEF